MNKDQTIERLCSLVSKVGAERFQHELEHDCFCHKGGDIQWGSFHIHEEVIEFIENSVNKYLSEEK